MRRCKWAVKRVIQISCTGSSFGSLFTFGQLPCIFFSHLTGLRTLPNMHEQFFAKMDPTWGLWVHVHTYNMVGLPLFFWLPRDLPTLVQTEKFSLTPGVGTLSPSSSKAQLLPAALILEYLGGVGETKLQFYSTWQTPAVQPRGPSISYLRKGTGTGILVGLYILTWSASSSVSLCSSSFFFGFPWEQSGYLQNWASAFSFPFHFLLP